MILVTIEKYTDTKHEDPRKLTVPCPYLFLSLRQTLLCEQCTEVDEMIDELNKKSSLFDCKSPRLRCIDEYQISIMNGCKSVAQIRTSHCVSCVKFAKGFHCLHIYCCC
jgi:hypothetical protein